MNPITLPVAELKPALTGLSKIIARRVTLPVLGCVAISRDPEGWVTLTGTDLDSTATVRLEQPEEGEPVTLLAPHQELARLAKECAAGDIITVAPASNDRVLVRYPIGSQTGELHLESYPAAEFPLIPAIEAPEGALAKEAGEAIRAAMRCASTDETRAILNGAFLDVSRPGSHYVVATDGRHLFASNGLSLPLAESLVIPANRLIAWKPFADDGEWRLATQPGKGEGEAPLLALRSRRWRLVLRALAGTYPNWRQVIPGESQFKSGAQVAPEAVAPLLKLIPKIPGHDAPNQPIQLRVEGERLSLLGRGSPQERWTEIEAAGAKAHGQPVTVTLNRAFLIRALEFGLRDIGFIDPRSPVLFSDGGRKMIVMTIRPEIPAQETPAPEVPAPTASSAAIEPPIEPASEPGTPAEPDATTTERRNHMRNTPTPTTASGSGNGNGNGHSNGTGSAARETRTPIEAALGQIEALKSSIKSAKDGLTELTETLRQAQREQRASEREVQSARSTLEKLQSVKL